MSPRSTSHRPRQAYIQYRSKVTSHSLALLLQVTGYTRSRNKSAIHSTSTQHSKIIESQLFCKALLYAIL